MVGSELLMTALFGVSDHSSAHDLKNPRQV